MVTPLRKKHAKLEKEGKSTCCCDRKFEIWDFNFFLLSNKTEWALGPVPSEIFQNEQGDFFLRIFGVKNRNSLILGDFWGFRTIFKDFSNLNIFEK